MKILIKLVVCFLVVIFGTQISANAQVVVSGKYQGYYVKFKYFKGTPIDIEYLEYGLVTELKNKVANLQKQVNSLQNQNNMLKNQVKTVTSNNNNSSVTQILELQEEVWNKDKIIKNLGDSLDSHIDALQDTILLLTHNNDSLKAVIGKLVQPGKTQVAQYKNMANTTDHHFGILYSAGTPLIFSDLLSQTDEIGQNIWHKNFTPSQHLTLFWSSPSLTQKIPLTIGVGVEYNNLRLRTGIGHLTETVDNAVDIDNDTYSAQLEYCNVEEKGTLHYIGIPVTLSLGQPMMDRISGYGQLTFTPAICIGYSLASSGTYGQAGHYSQLAGEEVDLEIDDCGILGFGSDISISDWNKAVNMRSILLTGRLSGGVYIPLCNTRKGKSSPVSFKLGVNVDFTLNTIAKELNAGEMLPTASYRLNQYNMLSGRGCRVITPSLEMGIVYSITNK